MINNIKSHCCRYCSTLHCCGMNVFNNQCYTAKNYHLFKVVENRMQQCCATHIVHIVVNNIVQHCYTWLRGLIQAQQCWTILLTTMHNVGSTTLLHPLFSTTLNKWYFLSVYNLFQIPHVTHNVTSSTTFMAEYGKHRGIQYRSVVLGSSFLSDTC